MWPTFLAHLSLCFWLPPPPVWGRLSFPYLSLHLSVLHMGPPPSHLPFPPDTFGVYGLGILTDLGISMGLLELRF